MSYEPFTQPLRTSTCKAAWRGGKRGPASWASTPAWLSRSGVHTLLRAAGLPRAELLHMGATDEMLRPASEPLRFADVVPLLGRIVWDVYMHNGEETEPISDRLACELGAAVIEEWFS